MTAPIPSEIRCEWCKKVKSEHYNGNICWNKNGFTEFKPIPSSGYCKHSKVLMEYHEMEPVADVECKNCGLKWKEDVADRESFEYMVGCGKILILPIPLVSPASTKEEK